MNHDDIDIDRILADENEITPSREFVASVMSAVHREAASLPPLRFPWMRALPGWLATLVAIAAAIRHAIGVLGDPAAIAVLDDQLDQLASLASGIGLQWIVLAVAVTIISMTLSSSLVRGGTYA